MVKSWLGLPLHFFLPSGKVCSEQLEYDSPHAQLHIQLKLELKHRLLESREADHKPYIKSLACPLL